MGFGIISLLAYIAIILVMNMRFKRKIAESMGVALVVLLIISGRNALTNLQSGITFALKQEVLFVAMAFVFMSYLMNQTGIIGRLNNILNSFLGRLRGGPGYVTTVASALFGMVSGSPSGNVSAVGTITLPWMENTGWSKKNATTVVAGNAGLGVIFPPSNSMFLLLGMTAIAAEVTNGELYIALFSAGLWVLLYRLLLIPYFVHKDHIQPLKTEELPHFKAAIASGWRSLLIFIGAVLPVILTVGPVSVFFKSLESFGEKGVKSISIIFWIPVLISIITICEGWKHLPHSLKGWVSLSKNAIGSYSDIGALLFFAYTSSRVLINLGLEEEFSAVFASLNALPSIVIIVCVAFLISLMVGPFTSTAATTAIGSVSYLALRSVGVVPVAAVCALLLFFSNEGCIPPNSAPIYISSGISGLRNPAETFKPLVLFYALPTILIGILICLGILPLFH